MVAKRKFWRVLTRIHKWTALIIGTQIILWFASGFFMSFFNIDQVHGDHMAEGRTWQIRQEQIVPFDQAYEAYLESEREKHCTPQQRNRCIIRGIDGAKLLSASGTPVWEFDNGEEKARFSGNPVQVWSGLSEDEIRGVSGSYYKGTGNIEQVMLFAENSPKDFGKDLPIWQVVYDDSARTRLYISPITGDLINVRTRLWRAFDFMWMLHIMDYQERDNINLWWLKLLSFCALLFSLSGLGLIIHRIFLRPRAKRKG